MKASDDTHQRGGAAPTQYLREHPRRVKVTSRALMCAAAIRVIDF
jgi:hypothetical protein